MPQQVVVVAQPTLIDEIAEGVEHPLSMPRRPLVELADRQLESREIEVINAIDVAAAAAEKRKHGRSRLHGDCGEVRHDAPPQSSHLRALRAAVLCPVGAETPLQRQTQNQLWAIIVLTVRRHIELEERFLADLSQKTLPLGRQPPT